VARCAALTDLKAASDVAELCVDRFHQFAREVFRHLRGAGADGGGAFGEGAEQLSPLLHQRGALNGLQAGLAEHGLAVAAMPLRRAVCMGLMASNGTTAAQGMAAGLAIGIAKAGFAEQAAAVNG